MEWEWNTLLRPKELLRKPNVMPGEVFRAVLAEFLATAMFVFLGCGSVAATGEFLVDDRDFSVRVDVARVLPIATCFGLAITVLAMNTSAISGGHINPAVTFSLLLVRKITLWKAMLYMAAQFSGAVFGAAILWASISSAAYNPSHTLELPGFRPGIDVVPQVGRPPFGLGANQLNPVLTAGNGFLLELMGTALLIGTVLSTAVDNRSLGRIGQLAPLPIGISIWIIHLALIPWTGCGINPARTFGPAFVNAMAGNDVWQDWWWIYYLGPAFGSVAGTMAMCLLWGGLQPPYVKVKRPARVQEDARAQEVNTQVVDLDAITI